MLYQVRIWDAGIAASAASAPQQHDDAVMQLAVAPTNAYIVTASSDKTVGVWSLPVPPATPPPAAEVEQPQAAPEAGAAAPAAAAAATAAGGDCTLAAPVAAAPVVPYGQMMTVRGHTGTVSCVAVAPSDEVTVATGSYDKTVSRRCG